MSWSARIEHTSGGLALTFPEPLSRLDMTSDVAAHLAGLLAAEARQRMRGVDAALVSVEPTSAVGDRQNAAFDSFFPENMPIQVIGDLHPLCCNCDGCLNGGGNG